MIIQNRKGQGRALLRERLLHPNHNPYHNHSLYPPPVPPVPIVPDNPIPVPATSIPPLIGRPSARQPGYKLPVYKYPIHSSKPPDMPIGP